MKTLRFYLRFVPWVFFAVAAGFTAFGLWPMPDTRAISVPLNLKANARTVNFHANYSDDYLISVEMDQAAAKRLFPCAADPDRFSADCDQGWPLDLALTLSTTNGKPVRMTPSLDSAGGRYGGAETFSWDLGRADLIRDETYRLQYRILANGSDIAATRPHLVVELDPLDAKDQMTTHLSALCLAAILAAIGLLWLIVAALLRYIRRKNLG